MNEDDKVDIAVTGIPDEWTDEEAQVVARKIVESVNAGEKEYVEIKLSTYEAMKMFGGGVRDVRPGIDANGKKYFTLVCHASKVDHVNRLLGRIE